MEVYILDNIKEEVRDEEIFQKLKIDANDEYASDILDLAKKAEAVAKPKAIYGAACIDEKDENHVIIEGICFTSRLLSNNLKEVQRVFPYVATCGEEVYSWAKSILDPIERYWAEALCEIYLSKAYIAMKRDLEFKMKPGKTAVMNPGSLERLAHKRTKTSICTVGGRKYKENRSPVNRKFFNAAYKICFRNYFPNRDELRKLHVMLQRKMSKQKS